VFLKKVPALRKNSTCKRRQIVESDSSGAEIDEFQVPDPEDDPLFKDRVIIVHDSLHETHPTSLFMETERNAKKALHLLGYGSLPYRDRIYSVGYASSCQ
jgi:hypothetical protein